MATKTKSLNIRISEDQYNDISSFAAFQGTSVSALFLESVMQQIEDWEDIRDADAAHKKGEKGTPWAEVKKELGL